MERFQIENQAQAEYHGTNYLSVPHVTHKNVSVLLGLGFKDLRF